jgi:hypothetical protein
MIWLFLSVVLILFVINPGFRKWSLIIAGGLIALTLLIAVIS